MTTKSGQVATFRCVKPSQAMQKALDEFNKKLAEDSVKELGSRGADGRRVSTITRQVQYIIQDIKLFDNEIWMIIIGLTSRPQAEMFNKIKRFKLMIDIPIDRDHKEYFTTI